MKTICFNILNGAATQLPSLHQLSDAGAGQNLMHLTPTRDTELIVCGQSQTPLPGLSARGNGLLPNRGISPAVLSRGLLKMFYQAGYQIEFNSFNFNVPKPQVTEQDWLSINQHFGGVNCNGDQLVNQQLLPTLISQAERGCISILAECGVGGTTFSTFWLRMLTGLRLSPAGSTLDKNKLASKSQILVQIEQTYQAENPIFNLDVILGDTRFHDDIQKAICGLVRQWPSSLSLPHFAGGMMFVAPLLASREAKHLNQAVKISTTRWVLQGDGFHLLNHFNANDEINANATSFNASRLECLNVYEQGVVVEGCGLGGCLVIAEALGFSEQQIIASLEQAVELHINHFINLSPSLEEHFSLQRKALLERNIA
ncbi:hypothetical protein L2719_03385 [Shewanella schlegeliana]|uniref:Uncharacterized protein n=1 Tax=Shewanella schlegeliana TaxID=190308 RepID=A0ABS1SZR3_9GAMM|nr:hypothetical protein [Shewanella schlegeliana]MBL4914021.1 hypothetical protein [Shewanella schlegeliana]MCL1108596.1 hypothetical protein [Shewanella schlegeliana]GIU35694.1 hypothetical protein TUM4433_33420 [Shewanella schlegeliana]